ncbi:carbohydrate kinase [Mangrovactinospora gilvigrisea]|uniref:Carbohydrate kinase n=1 Tax=Mangrovactinospora gilvigrisea TaxID=1428644 RepID=A0A1J7CBQ9_9ACTN|nr:FGGY-family carbohydrate kinase [Mangrovactinospora gilvigrisea]OIV38948.1 carbohydrate kinase [Mangrovactinospora gilvigrisea]
MLIGLDVGTSLTKAVAFDRRARALAPPVRRTSRLSKLPGGHVEQDLEEVLDTVAQVVREVSAAAPPDDPVEALAITGQGDGLWLRDDTGRAVRPPISWMDGRAAALVQRWWEDGVLRAVFDRTGSGLFPGCHAPLLAHLREHEPDALARASVAGYCVDAVLQRLTGEITVDASDASLPFLDPRTRRYDLDAMAACGVEDCAPLLPPPAEPGTVHRLGKDGAELLGLPVGLPVTAGPFDLPASAIGAGVRRTGDGLLIVGTTLASQVLTDRVDLDPAAEPAGMWLCMPEPDRWLRAMPAMVGTAAFDWLAGLLGIDLDGGELDELLTASPPGARGVTARPYFSPAGERAPFVNPAARGAFDGLTLAADRADLARGLCEATGYAARHCLTAAGLGPDGALAACGGGTRSRELVQLFADILERPVTVPSEEEIGARGAVAVALSAMGTPADASQWDADAVRYEPRRENRHRYADGYEQFLAAVPYAS